MTFFMTLTETLARAARDCGAQLQLLATAPAAAGPSGDITTLACASARPEGPVGAFLRQTSVAEITLASDMATAARRLELDVLGPSGADLGPDFPIPWCAYVRDLQYRRMPELLPEAERLRRDSSLARILENSQLALVTSMGLRTEVEHVARTNAGRRAGAEIFCLPALLPRMNAPLPSEETVRALFGLEGPYILACSQQQWVHKRHEDIIHAFARAQTERADPRVRLVLTGQRGDYRMPGHRAAIERLIAELNLTERVHYVGFIDRNLQLALIRHAAALVQASVYEECPGASGLAEAACLGTPIIASDIAANHDLGLGNLRYFPPRDIAALARHMQACLRDSERGETVSTAQAEAINLSAGTALIRRLAELTRRG
jgi:glycosyltransferase involved in cell wall biosynthesis